jgi:hypothetical protein
VGAHSRPFSHMSTEQLPVDDDSVPNSGTVVDRSGREVYRSQPTPGAGIRPRTELGGGRPLLVF